MTTRETLHILNIMKQAVLTAERREFVDERCPYCGRIYFYPKDSIYKPRTCDDYRCVRKDLHPNIEPR